MQTNPPLLRHRLPLYRQKMLVLFDQSMAVGSCKVLDPSKLSIWIKDFPLPRKETFWNQFPSHLHFQPESILPLPEALPFSYPEIISITDSPSFKEWENSITQFKSSGLEKVVLARKTTVTFKEAVSPVALFHHLKKRSPNAFTFAVIFSPSLAFVGATPEKLFSRGDLHLETEALAGTGPNFGPKEVREFLHVKEILTDQLQKICNPFSISQSFFIKKAGNVSHLHYPFSVKLKESIPDSELIQFLHPTPAIGGRPRDLALQFIHTHEPFDRGLYAGTFGILSEKTSRVYVTIRSCMIEGNRMHIFTGAGITPDSNPLHEWEELNHKRGLFDL